MPRRPSARRRLPAFAALRLRGVDVRYEDHDANFASDTKGLRVDMVPTGEGAGTPRRIRWQAGATSEFKWEPRGTSLTLLGGRAIYTPELAGVENLLVQAPEGRISTTVKFAFHGTDRLQLHARGDVRGESLKAWYPLLDTLSGPLALDFTMPSEAGAPAFADVRLTGQEHQLAQPAGAGLRCRGWPCDQRHHAVASRPARGRRLGRGHGSPRVVAGPTPATRR